MIIIGRPNEYDWPEFWSSWLRANIEANGKHKRKYLEEILNCVNYKVCEKCGSEYALIYESKEDDDKFLCFDCERMVKGSNYNGRYTDVEIDGY